MQQFRKKPVVIHAIQMPAYGEDAPQELIDLVEQNDWRPEDESIFIPTLEGEMEASPGDWIIRGVKGEYYPCKPDIFEATYDLVA